MDKFKPWFRAAGFLVGLAVILCVCNYAFAQTGYVRYILHEAKAGDYDTIIVGASHTRAAVDPAKIDEKLGTNSLNMAIPGETVEDSYYIVKEAAKENNIKTVIFDIDYQYWFYEQPTTHFTRSFIYQQLTDPLVRLEYMARNFDTLDIRNVLVNRLSWNCSISGAKRNIKVKTSEAYKNYTIESAYAENGYVEGSNGPYIGKGFFYRMGTEQGKLPGGADYIAMWVDKYDDPLDEAVKETFLNLVDFCEENDIELICITSPITPSAMQTLGMSTVHDTMASFLVDECGLEYYDFNKALMTSVPRNDCDYGDLEGHMGGQLGEIYSETLGRLLYDRLNDGVDEDEYFYKTFEEMYENMEADYEEVTGNRWEGL